MVKLFGLDDWLMVAAAVSFPCFPGRKETETDGTAPVRVYRSHRIRRRPRHIRESRICNPTSVGERNAGKFICYGDYFLLMLAGHLRWRDSLVRCALLEGGKSR